MGSRWTVLIGERRSGYLWQQGHSSPRPTGNRVNEPTGERQMTTSRSTMNARSPIPTATVLPTGEPYDGRLQQQKSTVLYSKGSRWSGPTGNAEVTFSAALGHVFLSHGQPFNGAHWRTPRRTTHAELLLVFVHQVQPLDRAHCRMSRRPPPAAFEHVPSFRGHRFDRVETATSRNT